MVLTPLMHAASFSERYVAIILRGVCDLVCLSVTSGYCVSGPGYIKLLAVGRQGTPKLKGHGQGHVTRFKILAHCAP